MRNQCILVVDPNKNSEDELRSQLTADTGLDLNIATDLKSTTECLKNFNNIICSIFVSNGLEHEQWVKIVQQCHMFRPGVPIFLVQASQLNSALIVEDVENLGITGFVVGELDVPTILKESKIKQLDSLLLEKMSKSEFEQENEADNDFVSVPIFNFLSSREMMFDVFINLSEKHTLKICQKGLVLEQARVEKYIGKGLVYFSLLKADIEKYIDFCYRYIVRAAAKSGNHSLFSDIHKDRLSEFTFSFLQGNSVDVQALNSAQDFIEKTQQMFDRFELRDNKILNAFNFDPEGKEHAAATTMVSSLVAQKLNLEATYGAGTLGLASYLHNSALSMMPPEVRCEDPVRMSPEQEKLFYFHPQLAAKALTAIPNVNPTVIQAVNEHHVRLNGQGFPKNILYGQTSLVSQMVGASSDFVNGIKENSDLKSQEFKDTFSKQLKGFSRELAQAFEKSVGFC